MEEPIQIADFSEVTKFHGHSCPGIAIGYRASEIAVHEFFSRAVDEEMVAIVENDSCSVDAIQFVTGCTLGKGNLIFKDHGKHVYTFLNRDTGKALRISLKSSSDERDPEFAEARKKAFSDSATKKDLEEYEKIRNKTTEKILEAPVQELFEVEWVDMEFPEEARIFRSVRCAKCGELVSEHRIRVENGKMVCIPCFHNYSRA
ncbi:FmdE family protein [Methanobacterium petrolearium]|uniref:FmdE family protein n=1 Tax=Methanobacterium petrolearium TaxID=710190 RepID=UPI001AE17B00|nr:FmdE family protein [Methanobacterium petrolearium]MBP1944789.1 formylmethanofuran dehydrogenase subunit E [Methanobacterium petrolearium]BDZ70067.1 formylmethanofuran dehydrogenase subunit E [Methanobacterium petrolearium]